MSLLSGALEEQEKSWMLSHLEWEAGEVSTGGQYATHGAVCRDIVFPLGSIHRSSLLPNPGLFKCRERVSYVTEGQVGQASHQFDSSA